MSVRRLGDGVGREPVLAHAGGAAHLIPRRA
jgi:hypothetical protein